MIDCIFCGREFKHKFYHLIYHSRLWFWGNFVWGIKHKLTAKCEYCGIEKPLKGKAFCAYCSKHVTKEMIWAKIKMDAAMRDFKKRIINYMEG